MPGNRFGNCKTFWRKESNQDNALYINIGANGINDSPNENELIYELGQQQLRLMSSNFVKSNKKSLRYRQDGNKEFSKKNWCEAMRLYNQSLCFAEIGTENVALCYANRSACFLQCKKYKQCLVDIELAQKSNCPQRILQKLEERKNQCLKQIQNGKQEIPFELKLDFEPNERYPSLANNLEIERSDTFGRHITAKEDIDVGKTILIEKSFVSRTGSDKEIRCNICLRSESNFVPCKQCTDGLFCIGECENHYLHQFECGLKSDADEAIDDGFMLVVRSILIAINTIPNVERLMAFVERTIAGDPQKIPQYEPNDPLAKYRVFLELSFPPSREAYYLFNSQLYHIFKTLFKQPDVAAKFSSIKYKRFLKHLIAHHEAVIHYNCQSSYELGDNRRTTNLQPLMASYFNHSCAPNIATLSFDGHQIAVVVRPIKRGEQLFISYLGLDAWSLCGHRRRESRQEFLLKMNEFQCSCVRCTLESETFPTENRLHQDESYNYVCQNYHQNLYSEFCRERIKNLLGKCSEFMEKYGRQAWSEEMNLQMLCYVHMLSLSLSHKFV